MKREMVCLDLTISGSLFHLTGAGVEKTMPPLCILYFFLLRDENMVARILYPQQLRIK